MNCTSLIQELADETISADSVVKRLIIESVEIDIDGATAYISIPYVCQWQVAGRLIQSKRLNDSRRVKLKSPCVM